MKSLLMINVYFGKWPVWFDAHLLSIRKNPSIKWLFATDCKIPKIHPENIIFKKIDIKSFNTHINSTLNLETVIDKRKICDFKPSYGVLFKEEIENFDYWGFCDIDIIWGDIRKYIDKYLNQKYDVISSLENCISGHFTLIRNTTKNNVLFKKNLSYKFYFEESIYKWFDEYYFTETIQKLKKDNQIKVFWNKQELNKGIKSVAHQEYLLDRWYFSEGKIYDLQKKKEHMYLHFINWKSTMKSSEVKYSKKQEDFYISFNKIHFSQNNRIIKNIRGFINVFAGFWVRIFLKNKLKKIKKMFKYYLNILVK